MGGSTSVVMDENSFEGKWKVIGGGADCEVYKARHGQWGKDVAVKILGPHDGSTSEEDLIRQAELILSADSPYVMKVLGVFRGRTPQCSVMSVGVVMDVMERGSLYSLQENRETELPWSLVFRLVHQVAEGMKYLHSLTPDALIHNNLKPENILLDSDLNVKISDFGLTRFANSVTANPGKGVKTLYFAPPEAFPEPEEAPPGRAKPAYDVYSYGVLVWTILNPGYIITRDAITYKCRPNIRKVKLDIKEKKAEGLEELLDLMKSCWSEDPKIRKTFAEWTAVTGDLYEKNKHRISISQVKEELDGAVIRKYPKTDFQRLTMDPNTATNCLTLSENNRKVTEDGQRHSYPDHADRFDFWPQVLSIESLAERSYWEVEWTGYYAHIAVTYGGISRTGSSEVWFGWNDKSWSLFCRGDSYSVRPDNEVTFGPVTPSRGSNKVAVDSTGSEIYRGRVAVYVDHPAGTLSFYDVSSDTLTHVYTIKTTFTEPLYAGFAVGPATSVHGHDPSMRLCEQR